MNAVATRSPRPQSKDITEIAKMVLIAAVTLVLMAFATSGSSAALSETPAATNTAAKQHLLYTADH
ncbi:MAG: hypothetical protein HKN05_20865 [Rhizobiales bacterium]|nr:hypothetical protein [Hyphomicrobiales bacterium]